MKSEKLLDNTLNIQLFAEQGEPGGGDPQPAPVTQPGGDSTPPVNQQQTNSNTVQQEKWETIKPENFKNIAQEHIVEYIEQAKKKGVSSDVALHQLTARENYITAQREAMTPDLRELDPIIENFIAKEENQEFKDVFERLAENALGRKFLKDRVLNIGQQGGDNKMDSGGLKGMTREEFTTRYNEAYKAKKNGDSTKMKELEDFARESEDSYYRDFLMLDK